MSYRAITKSRFHIKIYHHQFVDFVTVVILFLFFTLIVCVTAGLTKYKMMFLKHLQESNSIISFPETYHLLWCNDLYLYLVILFLGTCELVVLHKCDWRKGISWCVQVREIISRKKLTFKLGFLSFRTVTRRSVNNFYY